MKLDLPKIAIAAALSGISWEAPPVALARWNAALHAREEEKAEDDNTISMYDVIGYDPWTGSGVTAKRIAAALRAIGPKKDIVVNINSPGGDLFEGIAIYNLLRDHQGKVTTRTVGLAASAASVIAMAGDEVQVARAGFMMIHNVWVMAIGNKNDLRDAAVQLETFDDALASIYAARSGMEKSKVAKLMDKETWFSGDQAIEDGFADSLLPADLVEETEEDEATASASAAVRAVDTILARGGLPRSKRRALINQIKGGAVEAATPAEGTRDAAQDAKRDAGEVAEVVAGLTDFFRSQAQ